MLTLAKAKERNALGLFFLRQNPAYQSALAFSSQWFIHRRWCDEAVLNAENCPE